MVKVLVLSATGKQGGATTRALLSSSKEKHSVRVLLRDPSSAKAKALAEAGAEVLQGGDYDKDVEALDRAFAGVEALFFVSLPSFTDDTAEVRGATNIIEAAKRAGTVRHVVYSTVAGADYYRELPNWDKNEFLVKYWTAKEKGEQLVKTGGFEHYTILRPTEFMSNYTLLETISFQYPTFYKTGVLTTALPESFPMCAIDDDDIGRTAAASIEAPATFTGTKNRELTLIGEVLPLKDLVAQLGEAVGKKLSISVYARAEAEELAKTNPIVGGQLARIDWKYKDEVANDFGLGFRSFRDHLAAHRERVRELYKDVP
ncbi:NAD(P)-binding protein [Hypomontagnella submonticulosa]|nr:NAD(P)-binding protein [Hypomontagnella submonticulosa]